jgi:hypothetical protein
MISSKPFDLTDDKTEVQGLYVFNNIHSQFNKQTLDCLQ